MSLEEELLAFCTDWDVAMITNDVEEIGKFVSEDWVIVGTEGGITSRSAFLQWISSGDVTHHTMNSDETKGRIYENTGVVTSRGTSAGNYKGQPFSLYEWSTNVFVRKDGKWICAHTMVTPAMKPGLGNY